MNKIHKIAVEPKVEDLLASIRRAIGEEDSFDPVPPRVEPRLREPTPRLVRSEDNVSRIGNPPFRTSRDRRPPVMEEIDNSDVGDEEIEELRSRIVREISAHERSARIASAAATLTPVPMAEPRPAPQAAKPFRTILGGERADEAMFEPDQSSNLDPPPVLRGSYVEEDASYLRPVLKQPSVPAVVGSAAFSQPSTVRSTFDQPARNGAGARPPYGQGSSGIRPFAVPTQPQDPEGMVSSAVAAEATQSFERLTAQLFGRAEGERSIDDIARELLQPMLKRWLDQNLPGLVEGLVREEIERVSRRTRR